MKDKLMEILKKHGPMYIHELHKSLGINPANEQDRPQVWRVGQSLVELDRERYISLEKVAGVRIAYPL